MDSFFLAVALLYAPTAVLSYTSGPPESICSSLTPGHDEASRPAEDNPYTLAVDLSNLIFYTSEAVEDVIPVEAGQSINLVLRKKSSSGPDFLGFAVQARGQDGAVVGEFQFQVRKLGIYYRMLRSR